MHTDGRFDAGMSRSAGWICFQGVTECRQDFERLSGMTEDADVRRAVTPEARKVAVLVFERIGRRREALSRQQRGDHAGSRRLDCVKRLGTATEVQPGAA